MSEAVVYALIRERGWRVDNGVVIAGCGWSLWESAEALLDLVPLEVLPLRIVEERAAISYLGSYTEVVMIPYLEMRLELGV